MPAHICHHSGDVEEVNAAAVMIGVLTDASLRLGPINNLFHFRSDIERLSKRPQALKFSQPVEDEF